MFEKIVERFEFSPWKGTTDAVFIIQLQEKHRSAQDFIPYLRRFGKSV